jgi:hypothetical protein
MENKRESSGFIDSGETPSPEKWKKMSEKAEQGNKHFQTIIAAVESI